MCWISLLCVASTGCGKHKTYRVTGTVFFKGAPVPAGKIYFMPDTAKENKGPTGYADIIEGKFDTSARGGVDPVSGPMIVAIEGFDPKGTPDPSAASEDSPEAGKVKILFQRYEVSEILPSASTDNKFYDVPQTAADKIERKVDPGLIIP